MPWGFDTWKDVAQIFISSAGVLAIIVAVVGYYNSKNQFNFNVIVSCVTRFQTVMSELDEAADQPGKARDRVIKRYIDLCDEELFYFKKRYIPNEIIDEWLEGMVGYLPVYHGAGKIVNPDCKLQSIGHNHLLKDYPRIVKTFKVSRKYELNDEKQLATMIREIKGNLKRVR